MTTYCKAILQQYDPDRYLISLFAPANVREDLWALFAFNHEIAKTREVVSETKLGLIRLQWWREAIGQIYEGGNVPEHEVINPLAAAIRQHDLPREEFETLIYAREFDLEDVLPANLDGLVHYADFTNTPLLSLALRICGDDPAVEPVQPVAVNYGLTGLLRAIPAHAAQRRYYLPQDMVTANGVRTHLLTEGKEQAGLPLVVGTVAEVIEPAINPQSRVLQATQAMANISLQHIQNCGFDPLSPKWNIPPYFRELRVFWRVYGW